MKSIPVFFIVILSALSIVACSSNEAPSTPGAILFTDDFSNSDHKWYQSVDTDVTTDYYNNGYRILINEPNYEAWALPESQSFADVRIEVDATKNGGPDDNDFGIICRYIDENQYYYAIISSDGYYGIVRKTSNGGFLLDEDDVMLESNKINLGAVTNHIRFDCIGNKLTLYVNGNKLVGYQDSTYSNGNVGFIAGTYDAGGTDILFDNLIVYKP